ncbi:hypothetical protein BJV82DRAFT_647181 [Fennellomyces sp. T-0311]|nr:hypothetical protein BJV82DRAFT_647181 [Fennellomyces sp. T-0311]
MQLKADDLNSNDPSTNDTTTTPTDEDLPPTYGELEDTPMAEVSAPKQEPPVAPSISVTDEPEAIVNTHFVKLDEEVIDTQVSHWEISDWSELPNRLEGPVFEAGGFHWSILLFPRGNNQSDHVSVYVKMTDIEKDKDIYACAQFGIVASCPSDPTNYHCLVAQHRFSQSASDWGFARLIPLDKLDLDPQHYHSVPFLENNCIRLSAIVQVVRDTTGVLWHNFINYDSKKTTGFVGLKNQGATCYMNSLFQSLYCTNSFRKAVYQIPTDKDGPTDSIALALQRLFYNLQSKDTSVDTIEVTKSFGWDSSEAFMQHDVQEFNRILQDTLETKMKNTPADGAITQLFVGRMKSYIKCINVQYESSRTEDYYDIQLNVKGCNNLKDSFADYVAEETLEGENKYSAEGYGLQDAKKGVIFESFPPVLHLQLKRFEYDLNRDAMVKINDRHEFPLEIDLEPYLDCEADRTQSHKYILHGVLVHTGDLTGGHYFAFVKPTKEDRWLKFDDDRVIPATLREVLEDNYGGEPLGTTAYRGLKRSTNAYMLVYIRESSQDEILSEVSETDIPHHLGNFLRLKLARSRLMYIPVKRFEDEKIEFQRKLKERQEQQFYTVVHVITEKAFELNEGFDFIAPDEQLVDTTPTAPIHKLRIRKDMKFGKFKELLAEQMGIPTNQFRVWSIVNRQNRTIRPEAYIAESKEENESIENLVDRYLTSQTQFRVFIERIPPVGYLTDNEVLPDPPVGHVLVFIKHFDPERQIIRGAGHLYAEKTSNVGSITGKIKSILGYTAEDEIDLYEEIKPNMIDKMDLEKSFTQAEIQNGDIICVQKRLSTEEISRLDHDDKYPSIPDYLDFLLRRVDVTFCPRNRDLSMQFTLTLKRTMHYQQVVQSLAERLDANPAMVQLFVPDRNGEEPIPLRPTAPLTLGEIVRHMTNEGIRYNVLFYHVHDISLAELETRRTLDIAVCTPTLNDANTMRVSVSKRGSISDVLQMLNAQGAAFKSDSGTREPRIFEAINNRFNREFGRNDPISDISDDPLARLYAEEIPQEELMGEKDALFLPVFHFQRDQYRTHSVPFQLLIKKDEEFSETKKRLQSRTGMNDSDWSKVRFSIISPYSSIPIQDDSLILWDHPFEQNSQLGLDHIDKNGRSARSAFDKPLFIRG